MSEHRDMQLLLRYAREESERAETMLNKGGRYSSEEFQAYLNYAIESLRAVVLMSRKEVEKQK